eukprot:scpid23088/ scgid15711/ 
MWPPIIRACLVTSYCLTLHATNLQVFALGGRLWYVPAYVAALSLATESAPPLRRRLLPLPTWSAYTELRCLRNRKMYSRGVKRNSQMAAMCVSSLSEYSTATYLVSEK